MSHTFYVTLPVGMIYACALRVPSHTWPSPGATYTSGRCTRTGAFGMGAIAAHYCTVGERRRGVLSADELSRLEPPVAAITSLELLPLHGARLPEFEEAVCA